MVHPSFSKTSSLSSMLPVLELLEVVVLGGRLPNPLLAWAWVLILPLPVSEIPDPSFSKTSSLSSDCMLLPLTPLLLP